MPAVFVFEIYGARWYLRLMENKGENGMNNKKVETTIRTAACRDLKDIVELTEKEFRSASIDAKIEDIIGGTPWIEAKAEVLKSEIEKNPDGCFVAVLDGKIV